MLRLIFPIILSVSSVGFAVEAVDAAKEPAMTDAAVEAAMKAAPATVAATVETPKATTQALKEMKETEIPVRLEPAKKSGESESPWFRMLSGLAIVGVMAAGAYVLIKRTKSANRTNSLAPEIKVLSQHYLGPKKSLAIIRVAGESILLGVTEHNISMIKSLSLLDEDIPEHVPGSFESVFNADSASQAPAGASRKMADADKDDEFSISGIKDVVTTRLKNMRNFQ